MARNLQGTRLTTATVSYSRARANYFPQNEIGIAPRRKPIRNHFRMQILGGPEARMQDLLTSRTYHSWSAIGRWARMLIANDLQLLLKILA